MTSSQSPELDRELLQLRLPVVRDATEAEPIGECRDVRNMLARLVDMIQLSKIELGLAADDVRQSTSNEACQEAIVKLYDVHISDTQVIQALIRQASRPEAGNLMIFIQSPNDPSEPGTDPIAISCCEYDVQSERLVGFPLTERGSAPPILFLPDQVIGIQPESGQPKTEFADQPFFDVV